MDRKKKVKRKREDKDGDIISRLPDELIHKILSFTDARQAVQTSVLSRRWKLVWTTLPVLNFGSYSQTVPCSVTAEKEFIGHVLLNRNHQSQIKEMNLYVVYPNSLAIREWFRDYAISHNVHSLQIDSCFYHLDPLKLSSYRSRSLEKLKLAMSFEFVNPLEPDMWSLPALKTLDLTSLTYVYNSKLPISYLICLSSLQNLSLDGFDLPESFTLISLTTLRVSRCNLPQAIWKLPALLNLELRDIVYPANMTEFFSALGRLQNLTLLFRHLPIKDCLINCPHQLVSLIIINATTRTCGSIMVFCPKIQNFSSVGIFTITFGASMLENVYVKLREGIRRKVVATSTKWKQYYRRFLFMLPGFGSAKILSLDLETIKALSAISDIVARFGSPFFNLKYLKLPRGCKESSICGSIKSYLLDGSPKATFVTTPPQVTELDPIAAVGGEGDDQVRSSREDGDIGLWHGHQVKPEFRCLLDFIMKKYPETFEHFTTSTESKMFCLMKLNMLWSSVYSFLRTSMAEVNDTMMTKYKAQFADLQKLGFNVNWLVSHLNYIDRLFTKSLLHELDEVDSRVKKMVPRPTASGTVGRGHTVGKIGDYLFQ